MRTSPAVPPQCYNQHMAFERNIRVDLDALRAFCGRRGIRRLAFFGSVTRADFDPQSDVDVLYEFEQGRSPGLDVVDIVDELQAIVGRKVDFVPLQFLKPGFSARALSEAEFVYGSSNARTAQVA